MADLKRSAAQAGLMLDDDDDNPFGSDGSDFDQTIDDDDDNDDDDMNSNNNCADDDNAVDDADVEEEEFFGPPTPPPPPRYQDMSVEELQTRLKQHQQNRTLYRFLTSIEDDMYIPTYSKPKQVGETPTLQRKEFCTVLHFACLDENGERGEAKIRMILRVAAERTRIDARELLLVGQRREDLKSARWQVNKEWSNHYTPLRLLLNNKNATIEAVRLICAAWPRAVHIKDPNDDHSGTLLTDILYDSEMEEAKLLAFIKILLRAAEKTREGAKGLVSSSQNILQGVEEEPWIGDMIEENTALHVVSTYQDKPYLFLPLLLEAWPEALLHSREDVGDNTGSVPLHNVARYKHHHHHWGARLSCYNSRMRSIEAFLDGSTLEALSFAFLFVDRFDDLGFDLVQGGIEAVQAETDDDEDSNDQALKTHMQGVMRDLVHKKDKDGRTLLHYVAAHGIAVSEREVIRTQNNTLNRMRHYDDFDLDKTDEECKAIASKVEELKARNLQNLTKVCQWILDVDRSAAFVRDCDGMNPFHYAISKGTRWNPKLERLARLEPKWRSSKVGGSGLLPFMLAGMKDDVETSYQLLRDVGSVRSSDL